MLNFAHLVSIVHSAQFRCMQLVAQLESIQVVVQPHAQLALPVTIALISPSSQLLALLDSIALLDQSNPLCARLENSEQLLS